METEWAYRITDECKHHGIPVFGKQWGDYGNNPLCRIGCTVPYAKREDPPSNGKGGALLYGKLWREFPEVV